MATTIGDAVARVRESWKMVTEDAFVTDRYIHSIILKYGKKIIKQRWARKSLYRNHNLFEELPYLELIPTDIVSAGCMGIKTGCTVMRTKHKLPKMMEIDTGPVIRSVSTLDYSTELHPIQPIQYVNATKRSGFEYNTQQYYWILDGHIYIPDVDWEAVRMHAIFEEAIPKELCFPETAVDCVYEQDRTLSIPEDILADVEGMIQQELSVKVQIPHDGADDSQNALR